MHWKEYENCHLCPRGCGVNRYERTGYCGCGPELKCARAALHYWEEPCISGKGGSGTVFFSGCTLRCCFCQNAQISAGGFGKEITEERLAEIFLELEEKGAENINLVTAAQYLPQVKWALEQTRRDRHIPVVYNSGGYESLSALQALDGLIDIYLPDFKYASRERSLRYSGAADYPETALAAIKEMIRQTGKPVFKEKNGIPMLKKGVVLRHLVMPGGRKDSVEALKLIHQELEPGTFLISLLRQFTPTPGCDKYPELKRRITGFEYDSVLNTAIDLGMEEGFMQEKSSAKEEYIPPFDLEGI